VRKLLEAMPALRLALLVGNYAQDYALGRGKMTVRVREFRHNLPRYFPLPHPSWQSRHWEHKNPWFREGVLPALRREVTDVFTKIR
jgi:uracil-DNA glycosylase